MTQVRLVKGTLFLAIVLGAGLVSGCAHHGHGPYSKIANATITGCTDANITGTAILKERESPEGIKLVDIMMEVKGLKDGKHAVHIHEVASCEPCGSAKGHHDPGPNSNSAPDAPLFNHPYHMGDLVNIEVKDGVGKVHMATSRITLSGGRLSVLDENGSAFIIHTNPDLYCDQEDELNPGCAGGSRDACGIIKPQ
ncbi:MAG: superoxide dismutase family protein [Nitrospirales bacterium]|nr:superoxide dismutase family protein [Nitrospira sp.]MDR4501635.1 superoxide dismutase family protein [Nitrospirales bacterium]